MKQVASQRKIIWAMAKSRSVFRIMIFFTLEMACFPVYAFYMPPLQRSIILFGWPISLGLGLLGALYFVVRKGFRKEKTYIRYKLFWGTSTFLLALITVLLWLSGRGPQAILTIDMFAIIMYVCPILLLFITFVPAEICYYFSHKGKHAGNVSETKPDTFNE